MLHSELVSTFYSIKYKRINSTPSGYESYSGLIEMHID